MKWSRRAILRSRNSQDAVFWDYRSVFPSEKFSISCLGPETRKRAFDPGVDPVKCSIKHEVALYPFQLRHCFVCHLRLCATSMAMQDLRYI